MGVNAPLGFIPAHDIVIAPGADPTATAFVLHGILGSRRNWRGFVRKLAPRLPDWRFVLVDLRNHGDSHGATGVGRGYLLRGCLLPWQCSLLCLGQRRQADYRLRQILSRALQPYQGTRDPDH